MWLLQATILFFTFFFSFSLKQTTWIASIFAGNYFNWKKSSLTWEFLSHMWTYNISCIASRVCLVVKCCLLTRQSCLRFFLLKCCVMCDPLLLIRRVMCTHTHTHTPLVPQTVVQCMKNRDPTTALLMTDFWVNCSFKQIFCVHSSHCNHFGLQSGTGLHACACYKA